MGVEDRDVKWDTHDQVVARILEAKNNLKMKIVTPLKTWMKNKSNG